MITRILRTIAGALIFPITLLSIGCGADTQTSKQSTDSIKVGLLHSLSGTMTLSETPVRDAEKLAIEEINANGGVLGKKIEIVEEDGWSNPNTFAERADKLLTVEGVSTIFGCWTSASRKAVMPIVEEHNALLWYPVQYEGFESSPNIVYTGSTLNQQIIPTIDYLLKNGRKRMFLLGSDYIFPRMADKVIKAQLIARGGQCIGEEYTPLGHTDYSAIINRIKALHPDVIINTLNGDSNIGFFRQLKGAGISASEIPVMSFSLAEIEIQYIGAESLDRHMTAWSYYETLDNAENQKFVSTYKKTYGNSRLIDDPMEAAYNAVYLWKAAVEKANSFETDKVREALADLTLNSPEGKIHIDGKNQHTHRKLRIGRINGNGLIDTIETLSVIPPDPYLESYPWAKDIASRE